MKLSAGLARVDAVLAASRTGRVGGKIAALPRPQLYGQRWWRRISADATTA
ncbi:hypothetical protein [Streptomyces sp. 2A115]|uniref:hypothetical protein n=1 Tax=Streptomyces sp. 2A115 TaxID=3457439 RepID=UPI003FCEEBC0